MINTVLIGLGNVGTNYQNYGKSKENKIVRNHLDAILKIKEFKIIGLIDKDKKKKLKLNKSLSKYFFLNISCLPEKNIDLAVVASSTNSHYEIVLQLIKRKVPYILVEKPITTSFEQAMHIKTLAKKYKTKIYINFNRRYDLNFVKIKKSYKEKPKLIIFRYSKGLFNYGSHFIDFVIDWYGKIVKVKSIDINNKKIIKKKDPQLSFSMITKNNIKIKCISTEQTDYDQFEIDLFFKKFLLSIKNGGNDIFLAESVKNLYFLGYNQLDGMKKIYHSRVGNLLPLYKMLIEGIKNNKAINCCEIKDALHGMKILDAVVESNSQSNKTIEIK